MHIGLPWMTERWTVLFGFTYILIIEHLFMYMNIMDDGVIEGLSLFFDTLGDPTRLRILYSIQSSEKCVKCISEDVGMNMSAVSHQLRILKDRNLVRSKREGKNVIYSINDTHVHDIILKAYEHLVE